LEHSTEARYRRLYTAHHARVLAYCARRVGGQDALDLAAEVFEVAWRRLSDVPAGEGELPWLYGVAYRVVSHHWRGAGRRRRLDTKLISLPIESGPEVEAVVVRHQDYELVLRAAARLRAADQELLRLAMWEELSHQQIANILGSTVSAVRQRFHRAKRALAREFERAGGVIPRPAVAQEGGEQ
jgi:RNA polymerase sigma-70 factor (ECF subfamily)